MSAITLVTGATGKQGGATIDALLKNGDIKVRALTRNPNSPASQDLAKRGVEVVKGSLEDEASIVKALEGVQSALLVTIPDFKAGWEGSEAEFQQGRLFISAAEKAKLPHLVLTSVDKSTDKTGVPHFESKGRIEEALKQSNLSWTIFRPVAFMDNFDGTPSWKTKMGLGFFKAVTSNEPIAWVACSDIGRAAARALKSPEQYKGQTIRLAGDLKRMTEIGQDHATINDGKPIAPAWMPRRPTIDVMPMDLREMVKFFSRGGYNVPAEQSGDLLDWPAWLKEQQAKRTAA